MLRKVRASRNSVMLSAMNNNSGRLRSPIPRSRYRKPAGNTLWLDVSLRPNAATFAHAK